MAPAMTLPNIAPPLLRWYQQHQRVLPFRTDPSPYHVWVSEIMLQQTRMSAALPYYERFMDALPTVSDLAACKQERLYKLWEGLGYYSRARNLQKAAQIIVEQYGGHLPDDYNALLKLPGIGAYTAGAIASICFDLPVPAVDGNVLRVFSRLLNDSRDVLRPEVKKDLTEHVRALQPPECPGDYNQALMELGALVCLPGGAPLCQTCPLYDLCAARMAGTQNTLPAKTPPRPKKVIPYTVAVILSGTGSDCCILLQQRPKTGLLAGLWQPVLLEGHLDTGETCQALAALGLPVQAAAPLTDAKHVFTHLIWEMRGYLFHAQRFDAPAGCVWARPDEVKTRYAVPNAFKAFRLLEKNFSQIEQYAQKVLVKR